MARICYKPHRFSAASAAIIRQANAICAEYKRAGYDLTLRQLYYQFVARGYIPNNQRSYDRLGSIINDARLAGELDWDYLVDRTRNITKRGQWDHPRDILNTCRRTFHSNWWKDQPVHVEVWVEKEALAGVVEQTTFQYDVTSLACRGYLSQSEAWAAGQRFLDHILDGKRVVVIHLGDHDPSGMDMSRDNEERLKGFIGHHLAEDWALDRYHDDDLIDWDLINDVFYEQFLNAEREYDDPPLFELRRIALNWDQIQQYRPPPNPAKMTDSRAESYVAEFGRQSWELDALTPQVLSALVRDEIESLMDPELFLAAREQEDRWRLAIGRLIDQHGDVLDQEIE